MSTKTRIESHTVNLKHYKIIREISRGSFGIVFLVEHQTTHQRFAAKVSSQSSKQYHELDKLISREIGILLRVQAPTIVRFSSFSLTDFQGEDNITILMEYKDNGSLRDLIVKEFQNQSPHQYDDTAKQIILCGIAHGMMTLHSRRVIHRDLKPDNVLIDSAYRPYITDFGLSKFLDPDNSITQSMKGCGTEAYQAPEVI